MNYQLCGKTHGRPRSETVAEFAVAEDELLCKKGFVATVYNPVSRRRPPEPDADAARADIRRLVTESESLLVLLPGWETDETACLTVAVAGACGIEAVPFEEAMAR